MTHRAYITTGVAAAGVILIAFAQEAAPITGQWMIDGIGVPDQVQLTLHRTIGKSGSSTNSSGYPVKGLLGLSRTQIDSPEVVIVHFQMVRDAGTLACDGYFKHGNGAGTFTFSPDPGFIAEMRRLGYTGLDPEIVFSMAAHDVSLEYVRSLRSLQAAPTSADELISMRIHRVSIEYIQELQSLGYRNLKADELVAMRIHGVTTEFIRELNKLGYGSVPADELVNMRIHGATADFIKELKSLGYNHPTIDQLVTMRIHGVSPDYIHRLQERGMKNLSIDQMVNLRIHGIVD
jgi:hypothetical protein